MRILTPSDSPPVARRSQNHTTVQDDPRTPRTRRLVVGLLVAVLIAVAVLVVVRPFDGRRRSPGGVSDNGSATRLQRITERPLSAQTPVQGTLGYAGDSTIRVPAGVTPAAAAHAQGSVASAQRTLVLARASLAIDETTLADARSTLRAAEREAVITAEGQVSSDAHALALARSELAGARDHETVYGQYSEYTALAPAGQVVRRGQPLYAIDRQPILLLYGPVIAQRAFRPGMTSGPDVAELNANLDALGDGHGLTGDTFTTATATAVQALQRAHGLSPTGTLLLGSVVFARRAVRVTGVAAGVGVGATVRPGPVMTTSSSRRVITIQLDASLEGQVRVGDPVLITLPDNATTPGRISSVSTVAHTGQNGTTVPVHATLSHPRAAGSLDQAPVDVQITTAHVRHALVVPVNALLALASGGYAVEEVTGVVHHLVAVRTGLFDDADGLVQITGVGLAAGQRVVVPGS